MKRTPYFPSIVILAGVISASGITVRGQEPAIRSNLAKAIGQLKEASSYQWMSQTEPNGGGGRFGQPPSKTEGVSIRNGIRHIRSSANSGYEFASQGEHFAVFTDSNWMTLEQASERPASENGGRFGPSGFRASLATEFKMPIDEAASLLRNVVGLSRVGNTVSGRLDEAFIIEQLSSGNVSRRRGGRPATIENPQGTVSFTIGNGVLAGFEVSLGGSQEFFGRSRALGHRTKTTFSSIGSASISLAPDAHEILTALTAGRAPNVFVADPGFTRLFNGRDLSGWQGHSHFWSVKEGAITGISSQDNPVTRNTFIIARNGDQNLEADDFELRFLYRIVTNNDSGFANSGMQYRRVDRGNFSVAGYQADFEAGTRYSGILYDEGGGAGGRGIMAERGQSVYCSTDGNKEPTGELGSSEAIQTSIKANDWNEYRIVARGPRLQHFINGHQTIDVIDDTENKRLTRGILALQLHAGDPMTVQCKNIQIKSLSGADQNAAGNVRIAEGFRLELLYSVPKETQGSWVAMCLDPKGRIIASDQNGKLYRLTPPPVGLSAAVEPEPIDLDIGGAHGLLYAFDSLYVMVNEGQRTHGLYRVRDTNGDDQFDIAFNREGELFTYDADMEWDIDDPWYRPTRVNHVISGAEFGWRNGAGKWRDYYFDSFGSVLDIGTGSPSGIAFGYGTKFPTRYQEALFIADWSFGKLYALHLSPDGGSYAADLEEFISGQPFPITDVVINEEDGALYIISVGGRRTQSGVYRVTDTGDESIDPAKPDHEALASRQLRRRLESYHGNQNPSFLDAAWPHLGSADRVNGTF